MSKPVTPRKARCKAANSPLRVENWPILTLRLSVEDGRRGIRRDGPDAAGGDPARNAEIEVHGALGGRLGEPSGGRPPLRSRALGGAEEELRAVAEVEGHALRPVVDALGSREQVVG